MSEDKNTSINNSQHEISLSQEEIDQCQKDMQDLTDAASALFRIPVFFSHQGLFSLAPLGMTPPPFTPRQRFIIRMFNEIKKVLLFPRTLPTTDQYPNTTLENVRTIVKSSYGLAAALLVPSPRENQFDPYSPFLQIEPAMAYQYGLPLLLVIEDKMQRAGGIWGGGGQLAPFTPLVWFSPPLDASDREVNRSIDDFFDSVQWKEALHNWAGQVRSGYFMQTGPEFDYRCDG